MSPTPWSARDVADLRVDVLTACDGEVLAGGTGDLMTRVVLCVRAGTDKDRLRPLVTPMLCLRERMVEPMDAGLDAVAVSHATVRLAAAIGSGEQAGGRPVDAAEIARRRVAEFRELRLDWRMPDEIARELANHGRVQRPVASALAPIEHLARLLAPPPVKYGESEAYVKVQPDDGFDSDLVHIALATVLFWRSRKVLLELMQDLSPAVVANRDLVWARAAAEIDGWCGGQDREELTDSEFGRLLTSAWVVVARFESTRRCERDLWVQDLEEWAAAALWRSVCLGWGSTLGSVLGNVERHGGPLYYDLPDSHVLRHGSCYKAAHASHEEATRR